jgi:hypothetical protein
MLFILFNFIYVDLNEMSVHYAHSTLTTHSTPDEEQR